MEVRKSDFCPSAGRVSAVHHIFNKRLSSALNEIKAFELQENTASSSFLIVSLSGSSILLIYQKLFHAILQNFFYYYLKESVYLLLSCIFPYFFDIRRHLLALIYNQLTFLLAHISRTNYQPSGFFISPNNATDTYTWYN